MTTQINDSVNRAALRRLFNTNASISTQWPEPLL